MEVVLGEFSARTFLVGASNLLGVVFGEHKTRWSSLPASCQSAHVRLEDVGSNHITLERVSCTLKRLAQEAQRLTQGTARLLKRPHRVAEQGGPRRWSLLEQRDMRWFFEMGTVSYCHLTHARVEALASDHGHAVHSLLV